MSESDFTPLNADELDKLKTEHPDLPDDYLSFLRSTGYGMLPGGPMLYSGLVPPENMFADRTSELPPGILLFADDFSGTYFGFDSRNEWIVVAIESAEMSVAEECKSFTEFVKLNQPM